MVREHKRHKRSDRPGSEVTMFGYSNHQNPFNDPNLAKQFVWKKKDGSKTLSRKELQQQRVAVVEEVEKVKRRREERERERELREKAMDDARREREREMNGNSMEQEEKFHANILREKTFRRVNAGVVNFVDLFVNNIVKLQKLQASVEEFKLDEKAKDIQPSIFSIYLESPIRLINLVHADELTTLYFQLEDLERSELVDSYRTFYGSLKGLVHSRAEALNIPIYDENEEQTEGASLKHASMHNSVYDNVKSLLDSKTKQELARLRAETVAADGSTMEDNFKVEVLKQIENRIQKIDIREIHSQIIASHLSLVNEYNALRRQRMQPGINQDQSNDVDVVQTQLSVYPASMVDENGKYLNKASNANNEDQSLGGVNFAGGSNDAALAKAKFDEAMAVLRQEAELDNEDTGFGAATEVVIKGKQGLPWADKYAPRKPKYFNRVRSGYDWSGYNRTHYDTDNPPPKIVQGYKFNIFYPDLIDPKVTPTYHLAPANDQDFCIIHFSAGPPYEDIAFRIVNKEWAKGKRRGFRCTFDRGILQLHFNFTRTRYRR